jgi:hypothetical protein
MQRALSYALSPSPGATLRFLLTAPWFAVFAALMVAGYGEAAFESRWAPPALAITHLLTLGVLSMAMAGSMFQLIPVVAGQALALPRLGVAVIWGGLAGGAILLAAAFASGKGWLFPPAAAILAAAFGTWIAAVASALMRPAAAGARPMLTGMRVALPALLVTVCLGVVLAVALGRGLPVPLLLLTELHVGWGLVGWVTVLVIGVGFQVIPMFQSIPPYPATLARWGTPALGLLLLAWTGATLTHAALARAATCMLAIAIAGFAILTLIRLLRSKKKASDATSLYWRLALGSLVASALLACLPVEHPAVPLVTGVLFIGGFALGAVNGMLYKIVPFLLWYHLQQDPRAGKGDVPSVRQILPEQSGRRQFWWHTGALSLLLAALLWPGSLMRLAGVVLAWASLLLALDLLHAMRLCRAIARRLQPS